MKKYISLVLKLVAAIIMLQTLFFKFTGAQESIDLFTTIAGENEAVMRIGTGVIALIASSFAIHLAKTYNDGHQKAELIGGLINGIL